ncbi:MAG: M23 family metallopeptidase [Mariprofundus sp.]|nr:M23 family metallopeptidase [Mariprofundus sp.]
MKRFTYLFTLFMLCYTPLHASEYSATQGDVIAIELNHSNQKPSLYCFGKSWPVKALANGAWRGWVGVDMKKKPKHYNIHWKQGKKSLSTDTLLVNKGNFRISRITVKKSMAVFNKKTLHRIRQEVKTLKATYIEPVKAKVNIVMHFLPVKGIESTPFGAQRYVNGEPRAPHSGIDIAAPAGSSIRLPLAGTVLMVTDMYLNGKTVAIGHGNGLVSLYSHMQSTTLKKGEWIKTGSEIGKVGETGRATGPHLHWGVRFNNARVNPSSMLQSKQHHS